MSHSFIRPALMALVASAALLQQAPLASAQEISDAEIKSIIEAARSEMRASREQLLAVNMSMTAEESDSFWPLYREYNTKKADLGDERLKIIMDYATAYPDVDDATAKSLVDRSMKYTKDLNSLKERYVRKFGKVLPPAKLMRFLQIDSRLDNLVELQIQRSVPVVEPAG
jgi:hypothetical protein